VGGATRLRACAEQPELPELPPISPRVLVVAAAELVTEEVRRGRGGRLSALEPEIARLAIKLLADDATAAAEFA
jgi:hypothetical protein